MKTLPILHKEHFEAWLFSQPDSRIVDYCDCSQCMIGSFLQEHHGITHPDVLPETYLGNTPIPDWLYGWLDKTRDVCICVRPLRDKVNPANFISPLYFDLAKKCWRELFPEPAETLTLTPAKEQVGA